MTLSKHTLNDFCRPALSYFAFLATNIFTSSVFRFGCLFILMCTCASCWLCDSSPLSDELDKFSYKHQLQIKYAL